MIELQASSVRNALKRLRDANATAFGSDDHGFLLNPTLAESDVVTFEHRHNIQLPIDYRHFLTSIGDGGAGPYYGVFRLGKMDSGFGFKSWQEDDGFIGILSQPFPLNNEWNDLTSRPS